MSDVQAAIDLIKRGADAVLIEAELVEKLKRSKPLQVRPVRPHRARPPPRPYGANQQDARHFQELGHQVQFLIGDFTGMIGDPSGRTAPATALARADPGERQDLPGAGVQDLDPDRTEICFNSRVDERSRRRRHGPPGRAADRRACSSVTDFAKLR